MLIVEDNRLTRDVLAPLLGTYPDVDFMVMKDATVEDIVKAIRPVATDGSVAAGSAGAMAPPVVRLTKREREIKELIATGLGNKDIARRLNIATNTVKSHVHNMLGKLAALTPPDRRQGNRSRRGSSRRSYRFTR